MKIDLEKIKELRKITNLPLAECKKALEISGWDLKRAQDFLSQQIKKFSQKRAEREVKEGVISSYLHPNKKIGVLVELLCESDFVARSEGFQNLAHEICLQVAATNPQFLDPEKVPEELLAPQLKAWEEELKALQKPTHLIEKILENKKKKYLEENSLLSQPWIRDNEKKIKDLIDDLSAKTGEKIIVGKFVRFAI
jgi:elongation factor Ts